MFPKREHPWFPGLKIASERFELPSTIPYGMERAASGAHMARDLEAGNFGEQLRRERERRGLAVEAICATTKVPVRHILALEAGAYGDLPGGVFRRGFVRSYLSALGLEESTWMPRFEESFRKSGVREPGESGSWTVFAEAVKNSRVIQRRRSRTTWIWIPLLLLILFLSGWSIWRVRTHRTILPHPTVPHALKSWVDKHSSR